MLKQRKSPIVIQYTSFTTFADVETAVNDALTGNAGYCLVDSVQPAGPESSSYFILDEDWDVPSPIHSVVLVELTDSLDIQLPTVLSDNPDYHFIDALEFHGITFAIVLGKS